jgi:SAM-dependent methyltransferase
LKNRLDLGCGLNKAPGSVGVDLNPDATAADVIADVNHPLPFRDNSFDEVRAVHVIEHVHDILKTMAEIHRVTRCGGRVYLVTPHYTDSMSWRDPTHRWHLNTYSFQYWTARGFHDQRHWYTRLELRQVSLRVELARLWKCAGIQRLVNRFETCRRFWEHYLCFIVRAKQMEFVFVVVKDEQEGAKHEKTHCDRNFVACSAPLRMPLGLRSDCSHGL